MGAFVQKRNSLVYPNSEALYTAVERCMSNDNSVSVGEDGFISIAPGSGAQSYGYRGLGLVAFPSNDVFIAIGNVFCARDTSEAGGGDYILPLNFMPQQQSVQRSRYVAQMFWLRTVNIGNRKNFSEAQNYLPYVYNDPNFQTGLNTKKYGSNTVLAAMGANVQNAMPIVAPLVAGNIPGTGGPVGFNYDPAMIIFGTDRLVSHNFIRGYYGINTLVTQPYTQAEMNANVTP